MKIFFVASSRLVKISPKLYEKIYQHLVSNHKMINDLVWRWIKIGIKDIENAPRERKVENYKIAIESVKKADIVVMEVSGHSMSMGYLVSKALEMSKPVIAIHNKKHTPNFFIGINDQKLIICEYNSDNVLEILDQAIKKSKGLIDVRFNFFVSNKILNYLDWVAQKRIVPRSVFLRDLIEKEMKKDREFKG